MDNIKVAMIGLGKRGAALLEETILLMENVEVAAVCDEFADRVEASCKMIEEKKGNTPFCTTNYKEILAIKEIDAVVISAAWEAHVDIAVEAMEAGKYVGLEVGGAYAEADCWKIVNAWEKTGIPCMMLENCCYGQRELMYLNMAKKGAFGEIVHCVGGYHHDLRKQIADGIEERHYRFRNYALRNCDNYPTHELGPIAKLLNINNGNRMVSLSSFASKAAGAHEYIVKTKGEDSDLAKVSFAQGDIVVTNIRCAGGETITLTLDTTLPRFYSRGLEVHGTKGYAEEATNSIFLDRDVKNYKGTENKWRESWDNGKDYEEEFNHPLWKEFQAADIEAVGHDGMDWMVLRAFFECAKAKVDTPIDTYDTVAWMCISYLSEISIANGGMPVAIPDFTRGKWIKHNDIHTIDKFRLDIIPKKI